MEQNTNCRRQDAVINFGINKATGSVMFVGLSED